MGFVIGLVCFYLGGACATFQLLYFGGEYSDGDDPTIADIVEMALLWPISWRIGK